MILAFTLAGIVLIGVLGFVGRRRPAADLAEWTVGGRRFGALTMWFLQAGEVFTTFTFLGMAGLAFSGGVAAMYALPYVPIAYVVLFFLAKRLWTLGKQRGYLTQGDFLEDRYSSRTLGTLFDGIARHTQEGLDFVARSQEVGFRQAVRERDNPFGDYGSGPRSKRR